MKRVEWERLDSKARAESLARPEQQRSRQLTASVGEIIAAVASEGDAALHGFTEKFDRCRLDSLRVSPAEFTAAEAAVPSDLQQAIAAAISRVEKFHRASAPGAVRVETAPGVICERIQRPIERVGLYVPAGSAPLFSTVIMLGVPARLAGCATRVLCTPPRADGSIDPTLLYVAGQLGIETIFKVGGAQAIAAMAFGTGSVPRCDKLFGPGNSWVTEAKRQVNMLADGPAIDMPAGPSEVLVIADALADPQIVAADLLSQAEHGSDSQVLLVTDSNELADAVELELQQQLATLPRADIARQALAVSRTILVSDLNSAVQVSNAYAPEHLILNVCEPRALLERVVSAGSVFLGAWSPEAVGDYCSGTNHVLPTYGYARAWNGLSVASFQKQITVQELTPAGLRAIGGDAVVMAEAEGLSAHARAVQCRLQTEVIA